MHRSAASRRNVEQADYESHQRFDVLSTLPISVMIVRLAHLPTGLIGLSVRAVIILVLAPAFHCVLRCFVPRSILLVTRPLQLPIENNCLATWHDRKIYFTLLNLSMCFTTRRFEQIKVF